MLNKKIKIALSIVSILTMIITSYCILMPPKVLTRENNKGNEFEQLDKLMNTTRYAEQIRKAGYQVDDYDLKMMDRIPELKTLGKNKLSIESPTDKTIHIFTDENHDLIIFNKDMTITGSVINQGKDKPSRKLTEEEKSRYEKEIKQEINELLDDVYKAGEK